PKQSHECDIHIIFAETLCNVCHDTRLVNLPHNESTVLSCKFHIDSIDTDDLDLSAPDGFSPHGEMVSVYSCDFHIRCVRMVCDSLLVDHILILSTHLFCPVKGIPDPRIVRLETEHTPKQRTVCPMSVVRL